MITAFIIKVIIIPAIVGFIIAIIGSIIYPH